ncbi:MAG: TAT-variant-translocated molybdopterin oxidoreductase [Bryobacteraceae bacterium]|nr:TAT-variant-translocated molybdopterin oxidoreductase [Bryobacteraceae bacterium]
MSGNNQIDIGAIRERLATKSGPEYWRSLEELAETPEFQDYLENEFPQASTDWRQPLNRRNLLQLMGASLGLAGLTACTRQPLEKIVPYVKPPEEFSGNVPLFFATGHVQGGYATGILVESHQGRPTKAEGNPEHPGSLGGSDVFSQASLLGMYDPDRSQDVLKEGLSSTPVSFWAALTVLREQHLAKKGAGLRILTENVTSPSLTAALRTVLEQMPEARWHVYDPMAPDGAREGARLAFGEPASCYYNVKAADVIVTLDSDFLYVGAGSVRYSRDFAERRRPAEGRKTLSRLYSAEVTPTVTSSLSDHRLPLKSAEIEHFARALATKLGIGVAGSSVSSFGKWVDTVAADLQAHQGSSLVVAGDHQPPIVHAIAHAINEKLGNIGKTAMVADSFEGNPVSHDASLKQLVDEMNSGAAETVIVLGGNPVYTAPADLGFKEAFLKVKNRIHLGLYNDETGSLCHWHVPEAHTLESWGDARSYDGTVTLIQPLIEPLYGGKTALEIATALGGRQATNHNAWKRFWRARVNAPDFEARLQKALHDGMWEGAAPAKAVKVTGNLGAVAASAIPSGLEVSFRPDPTILDGRYANNGWLQELPKPVTKTVWDNAVLMNPLTAERLGIGPSDVVTLKVGGKSVNGPVWLVPGQAKDTVTVHLGYGRSRAGKAGTGVGFNANSIRTTGKWADSAEIAKTGNTYKMVSTQTHGGLLQGTEMDIEAANRKLVRVASEEEYLKEPHVFRHMWEAPPAALTLYQPYDYSKTYAWGMVIDLSACHGCGACTLACQAENNIPVVGKEEVSRGREMHWIRVDRYHKGDFANPAAYSQPLTCMHCENAPCEPVCPVHATMHNDEGINQMVYNRCVGTRYCSNNCPYKVRRFNFFLYADWDTKSLHGLRNPDVTVRSRGVMEKCTLCTQRITRAKIEAEKQDRKVRDGEILTACQQACPTGAIVFGDINDRAAKVAKLRAEARNYGLLEDLNTKPRVTYLARLQNPNPELEKG